MKKITMLFAALMLTGISGVSYSQNCNDNNEYVDFKNTGGTGMYTLVGGTNEKAAQTYHYSGPGKVTRIYIEGAIPTGLGWWYKADLRVSIYSVDANNRPVSEIDHRDVRWYSGSTSRYVSFSGGVTVNQDFAVVVSFEHDFSGQEFQIKYTGDGEGNGEDLPSIAGTASGGNWGALPNDGDLYIYPRMQHFVTSDFQASETCVDVNEQVDFTNMSEATMDPMFNTIFLTGYTGSANYYEWDFGDGNTSNATHPSHQYASAGVYTVTLTTNIDTWPMGGSTCSDVKTMQISVGLDGSGTGTDLTCWRSGDGEISISGTGGDGNYIYSIDGTNWQSSTDFTGLDAGPYDIYIQDGLGCEVMGPQVTLSQPAAISIATPIAVTEATCGNSDGALLVTATGGSGTLEYSNDGGSNYQATGSFTNLSSGTYHIVVKDANNCESDEYVTIDNNAGPTISLQSYTNVSCNGGSDGTITIIGSGGTGALEYSIDGTNWQATGTFTGLMAGTYYPQVKDAAGCITSYCQPTIQMCGVTLTQPQEITFGLESTDALCNGSSDGTIMVVNAIGGIGTLTYSADGTNYQSGTTFTGFAAGTHTITVKDAAGCTATGNIDVDEPSAVTLIVSSTTDLTCNESGNGEIVLSAGGGVGEFEYSIDGSTYYPSANFYDLDAGTYTVYAVDANGCMASTTATLTEPAEITATLTTTNSTCGNANGAILAVGAGGSGSGYMYSFDGGSNFQASGNTGNTLAAGQYVVIVQDGNGCEDDFETTVTDSDGPTITGTTHTDVTCNGGSDGSITVTGTTGGTGTIEYSVDGVNYSTASTIMDLTAGTYTVTVKDANGCIGESTETISEPSGFTINLTGTDVSCNGGGDGEISISAAGGSGTLAYSLNGIIYQSTNTFTGLAAGYYWVTVKDAGQCTGTEMIMLSEPTEIEIITAQLDVDCYGNTNGTINAVATGGTGAITYSIDGTGFQANGMFTGLGAGNYSVIAKDANDCIMTQNVTISEPAELVLNANVSDVSCAGGSDGVIDLTVTGGVTPMSYAWTNFQTTEDIFNLLPATYTVTVTDANGCTESDSWTVSEPSNPIIINGTVTDATGATNNDGAVDITVTGGTPSYIYDWSNGSTTEDISFLLPGVYVVTVEDANGCEMQASFTVNFTLGIDEESGDFSLNIFPNPARDIINLQFGTNQLLEKIALVDITGKVVFEEVPTNSNNDRFEVNINLLPEGVYFVNVHTKDNVITRKIVKSK